VNPRAEVKIIDPDDKMFGNIGDLIEIQSGGRVLVYFSDFGAHLTYGPKQLEYLSGEVVRNDRYYGRS
jgi:hypothetical protein